MPYCKKAADCNSEQDWTVVAQFVITSAVDAYMDVGGRKRLEHVFEGSL